MRGRITESAKWFLFAVRADDARRARYHRWISRLRRGEIERRRAALAAVPVPDAPIPPETGHIVWSGRLPGVEAVVEAVREIRSTVFRAEQGDVKPYLIDYAVPSLDLESPLLRFALSDPVVAVASQYLGMAPILTGVTVLASPYIPSDGFSGSQLFHCDWEDRRQVKVFVLCTDVGPEHGPLQAVSAQASARVKAAVGYHYGGPDFRLGDDVVEPELHEGDRTTFMGPAGTVTFIDTSSCLHLGSRLQPGASERLVVQFQFLTPAAFDLQLDSRRRTRPFAALGEGVTPLQRLVLGADA